MRELDWICGAENTGYSAWQAMVFHHSVYLQTGRPPIIAVMAEDGEPLRDEFDIIKRTGGRVQRCRNYRRHGYADYPGRNTPGFMTEVEAEADWVAVCDTDMLLMREPFVPHLSRDQITVDNLPWYFLYPEHESVVGVLDRALERAGLYREQIVHSRIWGGVPHIMHRELMPTLGQEWLGTFEVFLPQGEDDPTPIEWGVAAMWGLMFACARLGLRKVRTSWCEHNNQGTRAWDPWWSIIHYAWGEEEEFSKRNHESFPSAEFTTTPGSINEQVVAQVKAAREWYAPLTTKVGVAAS